MKIKTSITLTDSLVADMDQLCGGVDRRSAFIEDAIRARLKDLRRKQRDRNDLAILNERAEALNTEAYDVLDYQVAP